ncbi:MAG: hypothetical protein ACTHNU_00350 [Gaiellales bacterium]|jgi:hypothetical protein
MSETPEPERTPKPPPERPAAERPDDEQDEAYSEDEEAEVAARLESLGYM